MATQFAILTVSEAALTLVKKLETDSTGVSRLKGILGLDTVLSPLSFTFSDSQANHLVPGDSALLTFLAKLEQTPGSVNRLKLALGLIVPVSYFVASSVQTVNEGQAVNFTVNTTGLVNGTTLYWTIEGTGILEEDFEDAALTGSVIIESGVGTISRRMSSDLSTEGTETFVMKIRTGSVAGPVVATSTTITVSDTSITSVGPTFTVVPSATSVVEGNPITYTVNTTNMAQGSALYWSITGTNVTDADFVTISNVTDPGQEYIAPTAGRPYIAPTAGEAYWVFYSSGSDIGPTAEHRIVTSTPPAPETPPTYNGQQVNIASYTIHHDRLDPAVAYYNYDTAYYQGVYVAASAGQSAIASTPGQPYIAPTVTVTPARTGTLTINGNSAAVTRTVKNDSASESAETLIFTVRTGSQSGPVVATNSDVVINDISAPTYNAYLLSNITTALTTVNEGSGFEIRVKTTNVAVGTVLYYSIAGVNIAASDFTGGLTGSMTVASGLQTPFNATVTMTGAAVNKTVTSDGFTEGVENFTVSIRTGSVSGPVVATSSSVSIGDVSQTAVYPAYGTLIGYYCNGTTRMAEYADGTGGTYTQVSAYNSTLCGYVAPVYPANGTLLSTACSGTTKVGTYANGTGGTYTANIAVNSTDCGYVAPPVYPANGTLLSTACVGVNRIGTYANGSGGTYTGTVTANDTTCGYVAPPAAGTLLSTSCTGTTKVGTYANGTGGTYTANIATNSTDCGYVPPPAYGTLLSTYCSGTTKMGTYANGTGGTYPAAIAYQSTDCGYIAPRFYAYTSSGTFVVPAGVSSLSVIVVAGGGGGGGSAYNYPVEGGGGGGAGGVVQSTIAVSPGEAIAVTVGAGGDRGYPGNNSAFGNRNAIGGGGGGNGFYWGTIPEIGASYDNKGNYVPGTPAYTGWISSYRGGDGGSGGGGCPYFGAGGAGLAQPGQGNNGHPGYQDTGSGGGGGYGGGAGGQAGGISSVVSLGGESRNVAGGGGGGGIRGAGAGGQGGGTGGYGDGPWGTNGAANTGGGGGGGAFHGLGGGGGSGVVYIYIPGN